MNQEYHITLNFLPVSKGIDEFTVYRKLQISPQESRPRDDLKAYRLPEKTGDTGDWPSYWISFEPVDGFQRFTTSFVVQRGLTCRALFWALKNATIQFLKPEQFHIPTNPFIEEISFNIISHPEGVEQLVVQPYFLRATQQFGYLLDFHFRKTEGAPFTRRIQQLSLSLNREFRRNLDYYIDRSSKVKQFLSECQDVFSALKLPGSENSLELEKEFASLPADRLGQKVYMFASNRTSRSQFIGLRDHGPLKRLENSPRLLFVFREQDRQAARTLALGLRGDNPRTKNTFAGFNSLFKCDIDIDRNPIILSDLSHQSIEVALNTARDRKETFPNLLPIIVLPPDDASYLVQKAIFVHAEIPTQVCTLRVLQDQDILKFAIANLALQVFCKAGGQPWKVRPTADRSLIIGISQSHKTHLVDDKRVVDRYFAFSVMTDSSGLFQQIQILGDSEEHPGYIAGLRENLRNVLRESAEIFARVVIHTSFKLKSREIDSIHQTVKEVAASPEGRNCQFAVIKVNHTARFFGLNKMVNSLVPYEASCVKLGPGEYLIWFEGIYPDKPNVTKAFPGPTHLQILRSEGRQVISDDVLLQDLVNLSGGNWRGFNAKSAPVSVFYCHLVADFVHDFQEHGLPQPPVKDIRPWFL